MTEPDTTLQELAQKLRTESLDSLQLLSSLTDNPICSVSVNSSIPCVAVVWKRYATSMQLRFVLEKMLALLKQHHLRAILADAKALATIHAEDQRWITDDWFPRAVAAGLVAIANVTPTAPWAQAAVSAMQSILAQQIDISSFTDWEAARAWLQSAASVARGGAD